MIAATKKFRSDSKSARKGNLSRKIVTDYEPATMYQYGVNGYYDDRHRPLFYRMWHVPAMLRDSRIQITLLTLKGMITSLSRFYVEEPNEGDQPSEVKEFIVQNLERWWRVGATRLLSAMEWGFFGAETLYKTDKDGDFTFDNFNEFQQPDVFPVTLDGELAGIELRRGGKQQFIGGEKAHWHLHWRHRHRWWGWSRLEGAYDPWLDLHDEGGGLAVRRKYFYQEVFQGDDIYHPPGTYVDEQGNTKSYADHAARMVDKARAGGNFIFPSTFHMETNARLWERVKVQPSQGATEILEYVEQLRREESEGMGASDELFHAAETGSGYSGRKIPETAARGMLTDVVFWMVYDFDTQCLRNLVKRKFGRDHEYEIIPFGIVDDQEDDDVHAIQGEGTQVPQQAARQAARKDSSGKPVQMAV